MFITHESGRQQFASGLFGPGIDSWDHMTIDIWAPWFIVTLDTTDDEGYAWSSSMCLHRVRQLEEVIQNSDSTVTRLHLITPTETHPKGWQLNEVLEINRCFLDTDDSCAYQIVLSSGQTTWLPLHSTVDSTHLPISKLEIWKR